MVCRRGGAGAGAGAEPAMKRLLIAGCGPAGIQVVRQLAKEFEIVLVEPKDYFEFTPGILRGLCKPGHLKKLQVSMEQALVGLPVTHLRGKVVSLRGRSADVLDIAGGGVVREVHFDYAVVSVGSQYAGNSLWKVTGAPGEEAMTSMAGRIAGLHEAREQLLQLRHARGTLVLVGAGLVGVELAAELAHYMPGLQIILVGRSSTVLPTLPEKSQKYAHDWLVKHGVDVRMNVMLSSLEDADVAAALGIKGGLKVLLCSGVAMRCSFMEPLDCLSNADAIRVNLSMQVMTNRPSQEDPRAGCADACFENIYALGDCVDVEGVDVPLTKDIYPAEAMSAVVIANLRLANEERMYPSVAGKKLPLREISTAMQQMTLCSLGPDDCIFVMNGYHVATGFIARQMKHQVEATKMGQLRNELWGSVVWKFVPHW